MIEIETNIAIEVAKSFAYLIFFIALPWCGMTH